MEYTFGPWLLDIDVDDTKKLYELNDYSKLKTSNNEFINSLTTKQLEFFKELNVDLNKIEVDIKVYNIVEENLDSKNIKRTSVNFLLKGKMLALPEFQKEIYSDKEVFNLEIPNDIVVTTKSKDIATYELDGLHIIFKHPYFHFDDDCYKVWDSGYILASILLMRDE